MVSYTMQAQNENFSKNLSQMRNLAFSIYPDKSLRIVYDGSAPTSFAKIDENLITLSLKPYPSFVHGNIAVFKKVLDGDLTHELGHLILTKPIWEACNNWVTGIQRHKGFYNLASELVNIVEDKRINHYMISLYRHDIGKRLLIANLIIKDMVDNNIEGETPRIQIFEGLTQASYMMAILVNQGLYEAKCTKLWGKLLETVKIDNEILFPKKDMEECLKILELVKYQRVRIQILGTMDKLYKIISKYLVADYTKNIYCASRHRNGDLKGELSDKFKCALTNEIRQEEESTQDCKKDLNKGFGAGEGKGEEIPAPIPNIKAYQALLNETSSEITELLNFLKKNLKPISQRQIFQKRGKLMSPIIPKVYVNSFSRPIQNVYINVSTRFEKEQVAIAFCFDYSDSVPRDMAKKITTILNEVFGRYVDDAGFSIGVFGDGSQKVKTFFEAFENTKARVGGINVGAGATCISSLLESNLRQFNAMRGNRRKICVIASDFSFSDPDKAEEMVKLYEKSGIELIFLGFGSYNCNIDNFAKEVKAKRTQINALSELPRKFMEVYFNVQK